MADSVTSDFATIPIGEGKDKKNPAINPNN